MNDIEHQVSKIDFPVEYPNQVYLRKGKQYVQSYDPVEQIEVLEHSVNIIQSSGGYVYNHSFDEFDSIYVPEVPGEPVELYKGDKG